MENNQLIETLQRMLALQQEMLAHLMILSANVNPLPKTEEKLMTRNQVQEYLNITEATYKRWVKKGALKPMKMPGGDRFYKQDLTDAHKESIRRGRI